MAIPGEIIPAPLAAAPMIASPPDSDSRNAPPLGARSVVQIARPKSAPPSGERAATAEPIPGSTRPMSMRSPIVPVLHTATCSGSSPNHAAVLRAIVSASSIPGEPVAAFADPALTTTARILARSMARLRRTGADGRALVVSTIAETTGPSAARMPRSSAPEAFSPQATPAARNPCGAVTDPPATSSSPSGARTQSSRPTGGKRPIRAGPRSRAGPPSG